MDHYEKKNKVCGKIVIEPLAGMGNRFLALASAHELAVKLDKQLIVLWNKDGALGARCRETVTLPKNIQIYEVTNLSFHRYPINRLYSEIIRWWYRLTCDLYYHQDQIVKYSEENVETEIFTHKNIYIKSWKEFTDIKSNSRVKFQFIQPAEAVQSRGKPLLSRITKQVIGVHVRRTDHTIAIQKSPLALFYRSMEQELKEDPNTLFFLATDDEHTEKEMIARFPDHIIWNEKKKFARFEKDGVHDAYIDLLALSECRKILASYGSTFSRIAAYIGEVPIQIIAD